MYRNANILKIVISVICLIVLVLLYVFGERFFHEEITVDSKTKEAIEEKDSFLFDPEELVYDGTGELDFLKGVSLENFSPEELKEKVFISITTGDNLSEKVVEYRVNTEKGQIRSNRSLHLVNYSGPFIELPDEMPTITMENMSHIAELINDNEAYKAEDGFGNDAREHVEIDVDKSMMNSSEMQITFTLENIFGDQVTSKADVIITDVPAIITLTDREVDLRIEDEFNPMVYIEDAIDSEGESIIEEVTYSGDINTETPGEYLVTYELRGQTTSLIVKVTE